MLANSFLFVMILVMKYLGIYTVLFFCLMTHLAAAEVTIAVITPKAGDYAVQGAEITRGAKKAADEINATGGLKKQKIKVLDIDDQCRDSTAVSTAQMLSLGQSHKISLVIGPYCANAFADVAETYAKAKIFQIIPTTVDAANGKVMQKGLIKMLGYSTEQATDFFNFYNTHFAGEKVAVVSNIKQSQSVEISEAVVSQFTKHGKSVVLQNYTYDMTDGDYKALAKTIIKADNNIAFITGTSKNIRKLARQLRLLDEKIKIFINKYQATDAYFEYMEDLAENTYVLALRGKNDDPEFAETLVKLRLSGFETDGLALYGYEAVKLWAALVQKAGSFDYSKLAKAANNGKIKTSLGKLIFHNGTPKTSESYAIYQYQNGLFEKVN